MRTYTQYVNIGGGVQVCVLPLFSGHHAVWASETTQADICNNADDLVVLDCTTGKKHRFPISAGFLPWLRRLIDKMNECDKESRSPWCEHNTAVRDILYDAAERVVKLDPPQLNILQPPLVAPAIAHQGRADVDELLLRIIDQQPESVIG